MIMRQLVQVLLSAMLWAEFALAYPQDLSGDRFTVPFSDPSRPGTVKVTIMSGGISIKGYPGKEVVVETKVQDSDQESKREEAKGMKRIPNLSTGLFAEEENNVISIGSKSFVRDIDLKIQVPIRTSLILKAINGEDVRVEQVDGEIEVDNTNGDVFLVQVSGSVVAHSMNGDLKVSMSSVAPGKPMSFTSLNGDVDVTLPADTKATAVLKSDNGDIFSDFDIKMDASVNKPVVEASSGKKAKYVVKVDQTMRGTINGGGPEMQFKTFHGDIFIRKNVK
jgi:hypothetical protein